MQDTHCPICNNKVDQESWFREYRSPYNNQRYKLYRCRLCGMEYWTPLKMVPEFYESEGFDAYRDFHEGKRPFPRWALLFFDHISIREGNLLDIGCGDGAFISRAKSRGFNTYGIDLDKDSITVAKNKYHLDQVMVSTVENFSAVANQRDLALDVITFFEVLEHQDNPRKFLSDIKLLLKPGGTIAGSVPNRSRFLVSLDRHVGRGDYPPHHFLWFSSNVLRQFLTGMEFDSVYIKTCGNLLFSELLEKLFLILTRPFNMVRKHFFLRSLIKVLIIPTVAVLWLGLKLFPPNIYFQAKQRAS